MPIFAAHSVVETQSGLFDVTLSEAERNGYGFLPHEGKPEADARQSTEQFEWLLRQVGGAWYCPAAVEALGRAVMRVDL